MTSEIWQQIDQFLYKLVFVFSYVGGGGGGKSKEMHYLLLSFFMVY